MRSEISRFLRDDHRRLDSLLARAGADNPEELAAYDQFRRGLLKHIGMEEKILFVAASRMRGGDPLPEATMLRLDHGALAALLIPAPTPKILHAIKTILTKHNAIEEASGGVYETCEELAGDDSEALLAQLKSAPEVPVSPNLTTPRVMEAIKHALARAGYEDLSVE